jgi:hypothetical protein
VRTEYGDDKRYDFAVKLPPVPGSLGHLVLAGIDPHPDTQILVEVKSDHECLGSEGNWSGRVEKAGTGNLFIEYEDENRGPSGIAATSSYLWGAEWDYRCWVILPTSHLRSIADIAYERRKVRGGEWNNPTWGALVPLMDSLLKEVK